MKKRARMFGLLSACMGWLAGSSLAVAAEDERWSLAVEGYPGASSSVLQRAGFGSHWKYTGATANTTMNVSLRGPGKATLLNIKFIESGSTCFSTGETVMASTEERVTITGSVNCKSSDASPADRGKPYAIEGWFELYP